MKCESCNRLFIINIVNDEIYVYSLLYYYGNKEKYNHNNIVENDQGDEYSY